MSANLESTIARLESRNDLLETELTYLDCILRKCGFPEGITSLKATVEDLIGERKSSASDSFEN